MAQNYRVVLCICTFLFLFTNTNAQTWTWVTGANLIEKNGTYGEKFVSSKDYSPNSRYGAGSVSDHRGNMWIYGGTSIYGRVCTDLWKFDGETWTLMWGDNTTFDLSSGTFTGDNIGPASVSYPSMWVDSNDNIYLFGGLYFNTSISSNDLWKFNGTSWTFINGQKTPSAPIVRGTKGIGDSTTNPGSRISAVSWTGKNDTLWLFGGVAVELGANANDVWMFNGSVWTWMAGPAFYNGLFVNGTDPSKNQPSSRCFTSGFYHRETDEFYLFGGQGFDPSGGFGLFNDFWKFNGQNWTYISGAFTTNSGSSTYPKSRSAHGYFSDSKRFYIFGGSIQYIPLSSPTTTVNLYNDFWQYEFATKKWSILSGDIDNTPGKYGTLGVPSPNNSPGARNYPCVGGKEGVVYLFGGIAYDSVGFVGRINDGWRYDVAPEPTNITDTETDIVTKKGKDFPYGIAIGVPVGFVVLCVAAIAAALLLRRKRRHNSGNGDVMLNSFSSSLIQDVVVGERLGGGQFGDVFRGKWQKSTDVALKKLKSAEKMKEFESEATILQNLRHQNIVQYYGIYVAPDTGTSYIVTEFLPQGSLDRVMQMETFSTPALLSFSRDAAAGMLYLSQENIVHRDLALRNLLVGPSTVNTSKYTVKIADFGMSKLLNDTNQYYKKDDQMIPYRWCSPEVLQKGKYSTKSDVWAYGVVLWEIFTQGMTPYLGLSNSEVVKAVVGGERLESPKDCPSNIYKLMLSCWTEDPEKRPSFHQILSILEEAILALRASTVSQPQIHYTAQREDLYLNDSV